MDGYWAGYNQGKNEGQGGGGGGGIGFVIAMLAMAAFLVIGGGLFLGFAFPAATVVAALAGFVVMRIGEIFFADGTTPVMLTLIAAIIIAFVVVFRKALSIERWITVHRWPMLARHLWRLFGAGYGSYGILAPFIGEPADRGDFLGVFGSFVALARYAWLMLPYYAGKLLQPWLAFSNLAYLGSILAMIATHFWLRRRYEDNEGRWPFRLSWPSRKGLRN